MLFKNRKNAGGSANRPLEASLGVFDVFRLENTDDIVVVGAVKGKLTNGDAVYVTNPGEDDSGMLLTQVISMETGPNQPVRDAEDCTAAIRLEKGSLYDIRVGSVIFTRNTSQKNVHDSYIRALGDYYVAKKDLDLTDDEIESLSITDCAEILRLFSWFHTNVVKDESEESKQKSRERGARLAEALAKKLLCADEIYCVFSKATGEPFMFSRTVNQGTGYMCTPPNIRVFTKAYKEVMTQVFSDEKFEIKCIENGDSKDGIRNFLGSTFYLNGACGVEVVSDSPCLGADMLVAKPDYSDTPPINVPVTNPDLERWLLLLGQLGNPATEDGQIIYKLYYSFMARELVKARLLIPMKTDGNIPVADEDGKTVLKEDVSMAFPTIDGKYDRPAVCLYTDWKRLRMRYSEEWNGLIQPIDGMIGVYDCAINVNEFPAAGCYISAEMFEQMKQLAEAAEKQ